MWKLKFFVHCDCWENGGYINTHYFETKKAAIEYCNRPNISLVKIEKVSDQDFLDDLLF